MITRLEPNQIFVFGSNEGGRHAGGAARQAAQCFGAAEGVGEGLTGQSYAFPTLSADFWRLDLPRLERARDALYTCCRANPQLQFLLTKVGCGIAGYPEETMRALFDAPPDNLLRPFDWGMQS